MKKVMERAWEIAKEAVKIFGGKVVEYLSGALKMAWAEIKKGVDSMEEKLQEAWDLAVKLGFPGKNVYEFGVVNTKEDYLKMAEFKTRCHNSGFAEKITVEDYLDTFIAHYKKEFARLDRVAEYKEEAEQAYSEFTQEMTSNEAFNKQVDLGKFHDKMMKELKEEGNSDKIDAYIEANKVAKKFLKRVSRGDIPWENKPFKTGPIYDNDSNPTYYN